MKTRHISGGIYLAAVLLIAVGCTRKVVTVERDYLGTGWQNYTELNYDAALDQFELALLADPEDADGLNGLGWTYAVLGETTPSLSNFTTGLDFRDPGLVGTEILAGLTFTYLALGDYGSTVATATTALNRSANWIFQHDAAVTHHDLRLALAIGYYGLGDFEASLTWVRTLVPSYSANASTPAGRAQLAEQIETLSAIY
ncbi:tetratricopeptide repeat protein [Candidatus Neomarinimicrobiota bacterium]